MRNANNHIIEKNQKLINLSHSNNNNNNNTKQSCGDVDVVIVVAGK